jgi:hypothetical protein
LRMEGGLDEPPTLILVIPSISNSSESLSYIFLVIVSSEMFALASAWDSKHCKP